MKKLRIVACTAAWALSINACGGSTPEPETAGDTKSESSESSDDLSDEEFWAQEEEATETAAQDSAETPDEESAEDAEEGEAEAE